MPLDELPYADFPEIKFNQHESTEMPFRYLKGSDGKPDMPEVSEESLRLVAHGHLTSDGRAWLNWSERMPTRPLTTSCEVWVEGAARNDKSTPASFGSSLIR